MHDHMKSDDGLSREWIQWNLLEDKTTGPIMQHQLARNSKWQTSAEKCLTIDGDWKWSSYSTWNCLFCIFGVLWLAHHLNSNFLKLQWPFKGVWGCLSFVVAQWKICSDYLVPTRFGWVTRQKLIIISQFYWTKLFGTKKGPSGEKHFTKSH